MTDLETKIRGLQSARDRAALTGTAAEQREAEAALAREMRTLRACLAAGGSAGGGAIPGVDPGDGAVTPLDGSGFPGSCGRRLGRHGGGE